MKYDSGYDRYLKQVEKINKGYKKAGNTYRLEPFSRRDFEDSLVAFRNTRKREVKRGERKTVGDYERDLAVWQNEQYGEGSSIRQAKKYFKSAIDAKYIDENDLKKGKIKLRDFRYNSQWAKELREKINTSIAERANKLRETGTNSEEISLIIGQEFFGSE